jgi:hypothetical protein
MAEQGADVRTIQQILGHTGARTTQGYVHVAEVMVRDAAERMGGAPWGDQLLPQLSLVPQGPAEYSNTGRANGDGLGESG